VSAEVTRRAGLCITSRAIARAAGAPSVLVELSTHGRHGIRHGAENKRQPADHDGSAGLDTPRSAAPFEAEREARSGNDERESDPDECNAGNDARDAADQAAPRRALGAVSALSRHEPAEEDGGDG